MEPANEHKDKGRFGRYPQLGLHVGLSRSYLYSTCLFGSNTDCPTLSASAAVIVRIPYLHHYKDTEFLCKFRLHTLG
jgi:hypothetical protein